VSATKPKLLDNIKALPTGTRNGIILGVIVFSMFIYGTLFTEPSEKKGKNEVQRDNFTIANPGASHATEGIQAGLTGAEKRLHEQGTAIELLKQQNKALVEGSTVDGHWNEIAQLTATVQAMQQKMTEMGLKIEVKKPTPGEDGTDAEAESGRAATHGLGGEPLPPPEGSGNPSIEAGPNSAPVEIQVTGLSRPPESEASAQAEIFANLPIGSNFEAVLLNGMDASTAIGASKSPTPAVLRIKGDAILPSLFKYDISECFALVGGFGELSSERVMMRTEALSCIDTKGRTFEGKMEGYVVGEDGKVGARAHLVSKQGSLLAKTFISGMAAGLGSAFQPQAVQSLDISGSGGTQNYQYPSSDALVGSAVSSGFNKSGTALSTFYLKMADQMFPILELDAGRKMTVVLLKGIELKMTKNARGRK